MLEYKEPLSKRNKAETGIRYEWYAMQQRWGAKYWEDFSKPKIISENPRGGAGQTEHESPDGDSSASQGKSDLEDGEQQSPWQGRRP